MNTFNKKLHTHKAVLLLSSGLFVFLVYVLGCALSPITWSPDLSKIALLVTPTDKDPNLFAIFTYDFATEKHVLLDKVSGKGNMLSAPAWSPDGKWIAYYRIDSSVTQQDNVALNDSIDSNLYTDESQDTNEIPVKLMIVNTKTYEQDILVVLNWTESNAVDQLMFIQPTWSLDSRYIFFLRGLTNESECEVYRFDLKTKNMQMDIACSLGMPSISPDGNWTTFLFKNEEKMNLCLAGIGEYAGQSLDLDLSFDKDSSDCLACFWSPDSKQFVYLGCAYFCIIDIKTGDRLFYTDTEAHTITAPIWSPFDNNIYYIDQQPTEMPDKSMICHLKSINPINGFIETVFTFMDVNRSDDNMRYAISPNGRMVILRTLLDNNTSKEKYALIWWDGQEQKTIETDDWLDGKTQ